MISTISSSQARVVHRKVDTSLNEAISRYRAWWLSETKSVIHVTNVIDTTWEIVESEIQAQIPVEVRYLYNMLYQGNGLLYGGPFKELMPSFAIVPPNLIPTCKNRHLLEKLHRFEIPILFEPDFMSLFITIDLNPFTPERCIRIASLDDNIDNLDRRIFSSVTSMINQLAVSGELGLVSVMDDYRVKPTDDYWEFMRNKTGFNQWDRYKDYFNS